MIPDLFKSRLHGTYCWYRHSPQQARSYCTTYIYGIGRSRAAKVLAEAGVDENKKVETWSDDEVGAIRTAIATGFKVEGELRSETSQDIKRLMDIGCQRGIRHRNSLPLRGQRTKNNSRTRKGKRKTVANKKK